MRLIQLLFNALAWMSLPEKRWPEVARVSSYLAKESYTMKDALKYIAPLLFVMMAAGNAFAAAGTSSGPTADTPSQTQMPPDCKKNPDDPRCQKK